MPIMVHAASHSGDATMLDLTLSPLSPLDPEHRDLDAAIHRIADTPNHDQLALTRMKRRELLLKDQLAWIERQLNPDIRS